MADTANLILPLMAAAQSQKHVTHNEAVLRLDVLVQLAVKSTTLTAPPGSPADGDRYLIASGPTGAWAGKDLNITYYSSGAWVFLPPRKGWLCWDEVNDILLVWTGAAWSDYAQAGGFVTNTTLGAGNLTAKIKDANFTLTDDAVTSKAMRFELSAITAANTRILNIQDRNGTVALTDQTQTWSGSITFSNATLTFGSSTAAGTISIGTGATVAAATKTINVGTSGVATSVTNITFGSAVAGALGTTTFNTPTVTFGSNVTAIGAAAANLSALYVGIGGATANATNRLSINTGAALFNNAGSSINLTLNKNATANDASLTFQVGFSARALVGLLASDDFIFKVSPDGSAYFSGIRTHGLLHGRVSSKSAERRIYQQWQARPGSATLDQEGLTATITGTLHSVTSAASNLFTQSPRVKVTSAASVGAAAAANGYSLYLWRGNAADMGGFYVRMVAGIETFQAASRMFMGLYSSAAVIGNVNPSTLLNVIGVGFDSGDTTLSLINNDGTAGAVKTNLGAGFPTTGGQDLYELILSAEPNGSEVRYRVERLNGGNVAEGTVTTRLPLNTQFLTPHFWYNNGTSAGSTELAIHAMYAESASMLGSRGLIA